MAPPSLGSGNNPRSGGRSAARRAAEALSIRCAILSVKLRGTRDVASARQELEDIAKHTRNGILIRTVGRGDVLANLMLIRATHEFAAAAAAASPNPDAKKDHLQFAAQTLLPLCKRIIQEFISQNGMDGIWMEDGGLLAALPHRGPKNPALAAPLRLNGYWYAALESTGIALRGLPPFATGVKDPSGDHFERLAGRFRRAFSKIFWCEKHQRVCPPELRQNDDHGDLPDAEQLLLMLLPSSPMPRTKQIGVLKQLEARALAPVGLWVRQPDGTLVESLLHRAWMAQALGNLAESDADRQRAVNAARPLEAVWELAKTTGVFPFYRDGTPFGKGPSPLVTAEVLMTLDRFLTLPGHSA
jgi:hypothetical protein